MLQLMLLGSFHIVQKKKNNKVERYSKGFEHVFRLVHEACGDAKRCREGCLLYTGE